MGFEVELYEWRDGSLVPKTTLSVGVDPWDLCFLGDRLVVHGLALSKPDALHVFDLEGNRESSFGIVYNSANDLVNYKLGRGHIACVPEAGFIVYAPGGLLGEVRAYSLDGEVLWGARFDHFRPIYLGELDHGGTRVRIPDEGFEVVQVLDYVSWLDRILVQVGTSTRESLEDALEFEHLASYFLDPWTGEGGLISRSLPKVLWVDDDAIVTSEVSEYPRLRVRATSGLGGTTRRAAESLTATRPPH